MGHGPGNTNKVQQVPRSETSVDTYDRHEPKDICNEKKILQEGNPHSFIVQCLKK